MKCNCLETTLEKITEKIAENSKNVIDLKCDWDGRVFRMDGGCGVGLYIKSTYYKTKKNGTPYANKTKDLHFVAMTFCPFCGEKLSVEK